MNLVFKVFAQFHLHSIWKEPATITSRISIAFLLPGVVEKSGFSVCVIHKGTDLKITGKWPALFMDLALMRKCGS